MRKLACFTFGFAAAITLAMYAPGEHVIVLASLAGTITMLLSFSHLKRYYAIRLFVFAFFAGTLWWMVYYAVFYETAIELCDTETVTEFTVLDYPEHHEYSSRVFVKTGSGHRVNLKLNDSIDLKPGDRLSLNVYFKLPEETRDFDFLTYYRAKGIFLDAVQRGPAIIRKCDRTPLPLVPAVVRHSINEKLAELFTDDKKGLISALLTGDRSDMSPGFQFSLSVAGMSHIISISGMHVSFLAGSIFSVFGKRKAASIVAIPAMVFFVLMTGAAPSAVRACVMQIIVLVSGAINREDDPPTSLAAALLLLLLINPFSIADIGLQLSFLTTAGIILFSAKINTWLKDRLPRKIRNNYIARFITGTLSASLSASLMTFLPVMLYFRRLSLIAPLSNLFSLWMVSAVFIAGMVCVSISFVCMPIARLMAVPIGFGLKYIKSVADISLRIPYSSLDADDPYIAAWFVFAGILTVIWICAERKREITILTSSLVAVGLAFSLLLSEISVLSHDLVIDVLDVGQGQSIVVTSGAYTALIDCGGNRWPGAGNIATQHLLAGNRRRIDLLLLTHNHADHVNGIEDLLDHVHVECAAVPATEACEETAAFLREKGVGVISVNDNHTVALGKCRIRLFRPIVKESGVEEAMCILVSTGDFDALITGDSAFISERILIEREALHDIELLVAGHHGSGRSTGEKLLDAVRPETAVISVGVNSYGHPSPQAISRLRNRGTDIYRTDLQGGIKISVKG